MEDLKAAMELARTYFPDLPESELHKVIACTGFPSGWRIPKDGNTPEECFRKQLKSVKAFKDKFDLFPDFDDDMDHVYPGAQG